MNDTHPAARSNRTLSPHPEPRSAQLTPRQLEVLSRLCEGKPNKVIARELGLAGPTVKGHVAAVLRSLNAASRLQAVVNAHRLGWVERSGHRIEPDMAVSRAM